MKVYMLLDPHVPMLKGWAGGSIEFSQIYESKSCVPNMFWLKLEVLLDAEVPL
jgi:hypothetical protein